MSKAVVVAAPPYTAPYAADRAWNTDGRDAWSLDAMRHGYAHVLDAAVTMDERDPAMKRESGVTAIRFRSNRIPIDNDIVDLVMSASWEKLSAHIKWRVEHLEEIVDYPRQCLDAFAQDVVDAVEDAGQYDRWMAERWQQAWRDMEALAAPWLGDWPIYEGSAE